MTSQYLPGDHVPSTFDAGIVAASYFASFCGCWLTVEILHNRGTAVRNLRSWLETIACSVSMGLAGIWCMHFIGNRAIILGDGDPDIQLVYRSNFTVLSVFLPVLGLTGLFGGAECQCKTKWSRWLLVGSVGAGAGACIVGMHYVGNFGVTNYKLSYRTSYFVASCIIAVGDCFIVLVLFYDLREKWLSTWWKRVLCAAALAGGVSAMHFTASRGCKYTLKHYNTDGQMTSRNIQVIVAAIMCGVAALITLLYLLIARWRYKQHKRKAQKVMLAAVVFDPDGRILVTTDGTLPAREITDKYNHRSFDDEFDTSHPVFQWIFRLSHNWSAVNSLIPSMKSHLHGQNLSTETSHPPSSHSSAIYDAETYSNYELLFKERFCTVASAMALSFGLKLEQLGVLYDQIIETGTLRTEDRASRRNTGTDDKTPAEMEAALRQHFFGNGQLMFTVKSATVEETDSLLNAGMRFASVSHVRRNIAYALQIPHAEAEHHLADLRRYLDDMQSTQKRGTWLAFFAMIPKPHSKGFDVVVKRGRQDELPDVHLLPGLPQAWQILFLERFDGKGVSHIRTQLDDLLAKERLQMHEVQFARLLQRGIADLVMAFPDEWVRGAKFWARQLFVRYACSSTVTTLYAFTVIGDAHAKIGTSLAIARTPKTFLEARHRCYPGSSDHVELQQRIYANFIPLYSNKIVKPSRHKKLSVAVSGSANPISKLKKSCSGSRESSGGSINDYGEDSLCIELVDSMFQSSTESSPGNERHASKRFGGILVNSETVVNTDDKDDLAHDPGSTPLPMGRTANITTVKPETTFVNELASITKERFLPALKGTM